MDQGTRLEALHVQLECFPALADVEVEVARLSDEIKSQKDSMLKATRQRLEHAESRLSAALLEARHVCCQ